MITSDVEKNSNGNFSGPLVFLLHFISKEFLRYTSDVNGKFPEAKSLGNNVDIPYGS